MRVLISQGAGGLGRAPAERFARMLAGAGPVIRVDRLTPPFDFRRPLTAAEVRALRAALLGGDLSRLPVAANGHESGGWRAEGAPDGIVGYVCGGRAAEAAGPLLLAVADHVNLTWRSPLMGANDDSMGPRFPALAGCYAPEVVEARLAGDRATVSALTRETVAGVADHERPTEFEIEVAHESRLAAFSAELVPVVILAAHLGLRVAALVVTEGAFGPSTEGKE